MQSTFPTRRSVTDAPASLTTEHTATPASPEHTAPEPAWRSDPATENQLGKIAQLRVERYPEGKLGANPPNMTKGQASDAIGWLLRQRPVSRPAGALPGTPAAKMPDLHYGDGLHVYVSKAETYFVRVRHNVTTGNRYVLAFVPADTDPADPSGHWIKRRGGTRGLDRDLLTRAGVLRDVTPDEAARFGKTYGVCINCNRALSDDRSIAVGYGPVCAENQGWPWG